MTSCHTNYDESDLCFQSSLIRVLSGFDKAARVGEIDKSDPNDSTII